ncbi:uncharacterized protein glob1 [Macrobrachium rosenbergii]|uniref:uncharacterized protein glob1 n=1 Tax=Macrobrachium rosenbergii TaxID=79674 RepID=UPI0034D4B7E8
MGNNYTREDSIGIARAAVKEQQYLRRYRSFRHKGLTSPVEVFHDGGSGRQRERGHICRQQGRWRGQGTAQPHGLGGVERQKPPKMLTEEQKETIKRTWKIIETNVARVGVVTFIGLFETHPDVQEVFIPFRGLPMEEVQQSKELRSHALRVMGFVEKAVRRLEEPEKLVPLIQECGKNHCHYGAQVQHVELVGPEFLKAIQPALESEWTDEVEEAWDLLMKNIAYGMRLAMIEEMKKG